MVTRQLSAAIFISGGFSSVITSFSASTNVVGETSGPTAGAVPKAGGAPAGGSPGFAASLVFCVLLHDAKAAPTRPRDVWVKNSLRDFGMWLPPAQNYIWRAVYLRVSGKSFNTEERRNRSDSGFNLSQGVILSRRRRIASAGARNVFEIC